jgi:enoyl-CoA hydratase
VLGGGVGISAHGSVRIVTERTKIGMPETGIGFVPDVGGTHLLSRAPGEFGTHLALTAGSITGPDAIALGLADHYVNSQEIPKLIDALATVEAETAVNAAGQGLFDPAPLLAEHSWINTAYKHDTVEEIVAALRADPAPAARAAAAAIATKSPTALKLTLASLRAARRSLNLVETLQREYSVSLRSLAGHDLAEGIRAQVIDKDRNPQWSPATLAEVSDADIAAYFADLGTRELGFATEPAGTLR